MPVGQVEMFRGKQVVKFLHHFDRDVARQFRSTRCYAWIERLTVINMRDAGSELLRHWSRRPGF
jgi:hypothetical protein